MGKAQIIGELTDHLEEAFQRYRARGSSESEARQQVLDRMGADYQLALWKILDEDQQAQGSLSLEAVGPEKLPMPVPFVKSRSDLIDKACRVAGRNLSADEGREASGGAEYERTCPNLPDHPSVAFN